MSPSMSLLLGAAAASMVLGHAVPPPAASAAAIGTATVGAAVGAADHAKPWPLSPPAAAAAAADADAAAGNVEVVIIVTTAVVVDETSTATMMTTTTTTTTAEAPDSPPLMPTRCDLRYCDNGTSYCVYWGGYSSYDYSHHHPVPGETHTVIGTCARPTTTGHVYSVITGSGS